MDCDRVFRVLLSGPFPTGASTDNAVERHLYDCPACAEIAEALRPAPELFHEALSPREVEALPGYHGAVGCDALTPGFGTRRSRRLTGGVLAVERSPVRIEATLFHPPVTRRARGFSWTRAAVLVGVVGSAIAAASGLVW